MIIIKAGNFFAKRETFGVPRNVLLYDVNCCILREKLTTLRGLRIFAL